MHRFHVFADTWFRLCNAGQSACEQNISTKQGSSDELRTNASRSTCFSTRQLTDVLLILSNCIESKHFSANLKCYQMISKTSRGCLRTQPLCTLKSYFNAKQLRFFIGVLQFIVHNSLTQKDSTTS